jgi:hypothetical protein
MYNIPLDVKVVDPSSDSNRGVPRDVRIVDSDGIAAQIIFNNFSAIIAPTGSNDASENYSVGSLWIDTVLGDIYICVDASIIGAASWTKIN